MTLHVLSYNSFHYDVRNRYEYIFIIYINIFDNEHVMQRSTVEHVSMFLSVTSRNRVFLLSQMKTRISLEQLVLIVLAKRRTHTHTHTRRIQRQGT
jgi:hypothetical protein